MSVSECIAPFEPRRAYVQVGATRLSYLTWGSEGAPLLLLHGITSSARTWWRVAPELLARGYRPCAFDLPGHGESSAVETHAIADIAGLIAQAGAALGLSRPLVAGHSWGGAIALTLAGLQPIERLVLVDPLVAHEHAQGATRVDTFLNGVGLPPAETLPQLRGNNPDWHTCDLFWKAEALDQCRAAAVRGLFTGTGDWDLTDRFARLGAPALLMVADPQHTIISPPRLAAVQAGLAASGGASVVVPGTTHNMFRGAGYAPFMQALLGWL